MGKRFNRFQWAILIISILLWAGCAQNPYYVNDLREDEALTAPFKEAAVRIAQANGLDVGGMRVFLSKKAPISMGLINDKDILINDYFIKFSGNNKTVIYGAIAHELAHKKLGHKISNIANEFEADRETMIMLKNIGPEFNRTYITFLIICKYDRNRVDDEYHPSIDERIKRLES